MLKRYAEPRWIVIPLLWLFFWLALNSLVGDSPTMDEQNHLARGLAFLHTGDPRLSLEHPPLVNGLSASLPYALLDIRLPLDHPSWEQPEGWYAFAEQLLWVYNQDATRMIFLARLPILFLTLGLGLLVFRAARSFWGSRWAGLVALSLALFDPNVMAHGRYVTTDVGGAFFLFLAVLLVWRMWREGRWRGRYLLLAGAALGLAFGSKLSALAFAPILALLALLPFYGVESGRWAAAGRRLAQLVAAGLLSLPVVWLIFGGQWGEMRFQSDWLAAWSGRAGPMPTFWSGVEQILLLSGSGRAPAYLMGAFSPDGFTAYFPVAFLVKTPLPTLILLLVALVFLLSRRQTRQPAAFLFLTPLIYFLLSTTSALNIGYRHLMPILPFIFVLSGGLATVWRDAGQWRRKATRLALPALLLWLLWATLSIHPHYLSYFNEAAGGAARGHEWLIDSNIDWGQDLLRLRDWMEEQGESSIKLSYFGAADPAYYLPAYQPLPGLPRHFDLWWNPPFEPAQPEPGLYAVSVSNLIGELPLREEEKIVFAWFRQRQPDARIGYSIWVYDLTMDDGR